MALKSLQSQNCLVGNFNFFSARVKLRMCNAPSCTFVYSRTLLWCLCMLSPLSTHLTTNRQRESHYRKSLQEKISAHHLKFPVFPPLKNIDSVELFQVWISALSSFFEAGPNLATTMNSYAAALTCSMSSKLLSGNFLIKQHLARTLYTSVSRMTTSEKYRIERDTFG